MTEITEGFYSTVVRLAKLEKDAEKKETRMKFGQLLYDKDEEMTILYSESMLQRLAIRTRGGVLSPEELLCLKNTTHQMIVNLIIKIDSSGIG